MKKKSRLLTLERFRESTLEEIGGRDIFIGLGTTERLISDIHGSDLQLNFVKVVPTVVNQVFIVKYFFNK